MSGTHQRLDVTNRTRELPAVADVGRRVVAGHSQGESLVANAGVPLSLDWVDSVRVNTSAVERRATTLVARRTVKKDWQIAWLLRAITCMDLTTLSGDDTEERVRRLCAKAMHPVSDSVKGALGIQDRPLQVAAVCVYHLFVQTARRALEGTNIRGASVSTGFPAGMTAVAERIAEIRRSVEAGGDEIDGVIARGHAFAGRWQGPYEGTAAFKEACGDPRLH